MATTTENSPNQAERTFYNKQMKRVRAELQQLYMNEFSVSESTFYKRLKTIEFSPSEKRFFREFVAKLGFNIEDFGNQSIGQVKDES
jgi:hypothetical protein